MNDKEFWITVRRGLMTVTRAVEERQSEDPRFWEEFGSGLRIVVRAIEFRYRLPHASRSPIGAIHTEPPLNAPARLTPEGVGSDGI